MYIVATSYMTGYVLLHICVSIFNAAALCEQLCSAGPHGPQSKTDDRGADGPPCRNTYVPGSAGAAGLAGSQGQKGACGPPGPSANYQYSENKLLRKLWCIMYPYVCAMKFNYLKTLWILRPTSSYCEYCHCYAELNYFVMYLCCSLPPRTLSLLARALWKG